MMDFTMLFKPYYRKKIEQINSDDKSGSDFEEIPDRAEQHVVRKTNCKTKSASYDGKLQLLYEFLFFLRCENSNRRNL